VAIPKHGAYALLIAAHMFLGRLGIAVAADIRPEIYGASSLKTIAIEGTIVPGDFDTFLRIVRENQGHISGVYCFSPGGNLYEAMKIGRAMRALELSSQAPMRDETGRPLCSLGLSKPHDPKNCTCGSAGFFVHIAATHRGGTFLAVHRPYFEKGGLSQLSPPDAHRALDGLQQSVREYMTEMGVPAHIQYEVLNTAPDTVRILNEATIKTNFWGDLIYIREWMQDKCRMLSDSERERDVSYYRRLANADLSETGLSKAEQTDLHGLDKKWGQQLKCEVSIRAQRRADAYAKYFGERPNESVPLKRGGSPQVYSLTPTK